MLNVLTFCISSIYLILLEDDHPLQYLFTLIRSWDRSSPCLRYAYAKRKPMNACNESEPNRNAC